MKFEEDVSTSLNFIWGSITILMLVVAIVGIGLWYGNFQNRKSLDRIAAAVERMEKPDTFHVQYFDTVYVPTKSSKPLAKANPLYADMDSAYAVATKKHEELKAEKISMAKTLIRYEKEMGHRPDDMSCFPLFKHEYDSLKSQEGK